MHEFDTALAMDQEFLTTANVQLVMQNVLFIYKNRQ